ncbi:MAG: hypothetical protein ACK4I0_00210 [Brevundimonas sp.]|uniref:hypothetical protein n=1 Tax=Brevundimonas sp. TaxID=1871086 RepID=UPI00391A26AE
MPQHNDTVHVRFSMRGAGGPFWQTNAVISSAAGGLVVLDGFDRQVTAAVSELKPSGANRWTLDWEIRTRP